MILKLELSEEFDFEVTVDYQPARPAPELTSHIGTAFADDGCAEEIIIDKIIMLLPGGKKVDVTKILESHVDIEDAARSAYFFLMEVKNDKTRND